LKRKDRFLSTRREFLSSAVLAPAALFPQQMPFLEAILAAEPLKDTSAATLVSANPYLDFARVLALFYQPPKPAPGIHPTASIASTAVIGPNGVKRASYDFNASKSDIISALNEICKAVDGVGITPALHQHTGTCIETRDEVYSVLEAVDTRYVKFGPDVGQLAKGGVDPVKVVKDFLPLIRHVHLKDWNGGAHWAEYCPLGQGKVDVPAVLALLEQSAEMKIIMVELDPSKNPPYTPLETARISKEYLQKQGYTFRS